MCFNVCLQEWICKVEVLIVNNIGLMLNIVVNYGGCWDIIQGVCLLVKQVQDGMLLFEQIMEDMLSQQVCMYELVFVDLVIRIGGEY